jgi:RNA polymerase sigma factor (sigma-70 family)
VLVNVCRDEQRRRSRLPKFATTSELPEKGTPKELAGTVAARQDLQVALRGLPYKLREVVVLRYYLEFSVSETAQALGIPEGSVKSATARAILQLKRRLSPNEKELDDADR